MRLSNQVLTDLMEACSAAEQGPAVTVSGPKFVAHLGAVVGEMLDAGERQQFSPIQERGDKGLKAAREKAEAAAVEHFRQARLMLGKLPPRSKVSLLAESLLGAQEAYLLYKQNDHAGARIRLERGFANDLVLEKQHGMAILLAHRAQLLFNLMHVEARLEHWREALFLGGIVLAFLEHPRTDYFKSLPAPWDSGWRDYRDDISPHIIASMHDQIAAEQVKVLEQIETRQIPAAEIFNGLDARIGNAGSTQVQLWLAFQAERQRPRTESYFTVAIAALRHGSKPSSPLWRSVATDVSQTLQTMM